MPTASRDSIDKITLCLEGFGLVVLCVYTVFTALMYCANRDAADAAKTAADAAVKQVVIAGKSLDATIAQFQLDQRAWIGPQHITMNEMRAPNPIGEEDLEDGKTPRELRKSLLALKTNKRNWKETKEPDLQGLIQVAKIKKRIS
jgi:hypothetical protein